MGDFGFSEMIVIGVIAIMIWGKDLPAIARKFSKWYHKIRRQLTDIKDEISRQIPEEELNSVASDLNKDIDPNSPPAAPTGLMAEATEEQVLLTWDVSDNATSYTVKRTREPEDPHTVIADGIMDPSYTDTEVSQGDSYYYVINAVNAAGESEDSEEAMASIPTVGESAYGTTSKSRGNGSSSRRKKADRATKRGKGKSPTGRAKKGKSRK